MANFNYFISFELELSVQIFANEVYQIKNLTTLRDRLKEQIKQSFITLNKVRSSLLNTVLLCKKCGDLGINYRNEEQYSNLSLEQQCLYRYQSDLINRSEDIFELQKLLVDSFRVNLYYENKAFSSLPKSEIAQCRKCLEKV